MNAPEEKMVFLTGKKVILRPINKEKDLPRITKWVNDPEVRQFISLDFPSLKEDEEKWFEKQIGSKENVVLAIETAEEGNLVGLIGLHGIHWQQRTATTGALIGEKDYWSKGYGTDAKMILLDYAFNTLNLRKICSSVISFNHRSLNYSLRCGYKIEGRRKKQFFKNGRYYDEVLLALFKKDWIAAWGEYQNKRSK